MYNAFCRCNPLPCIRRMLMQSQMVVRNSFCRPQPHLHEGAEGALLRRTCLIAVGLILTLTANSMAQVHLQNSTEASLPTPDPSDPGLLKNITDNLRGVWMDQGTLWYALHGDVVNVKSFGAKGDGVTDDIAAFNAALNAIAALDSAVGSKGCTLHVPFGTYRLSETLHIKRGMILQGVSGNGRYGGSVLLFDDNVTGIVIDHTNTSSDGGKGDWSVIRDLVVKAADNTGSGAHGIQMHARAKIENVYVRGFSGNGIHINTVPSPVTNANNWVIESTMVENNKGHGLYVNGANSNAGVATMLDATSNEGWGIYDSSFLGNTYVACHTIANTLGGYKTDSNTGYSAFLGCYTEVGQPPNEIVYPAVVYGGVHGAGFSSNTSALILASSNAGGIVSPNLIANNESGTYDISAYLGVNNSTMTAFQAKASNSEEVKLRYSDSSTFANTWEVVSQNVAAMGFGTTANTTFPKGTVYFRDNGFFLTDGGNYRARHRLKNQAPTSGTWGAGDITWNRAVAAGDPVAWVCTVAGTPGTWVPLAYAPLQATVTWDPGAIASGAAASTTMTVNGASVGDLVSASFTAVGSNVVTLTGQVQGANTVRIVLQNLTGASLDLPSGDLYVQLHKP